MRAVVLLLLALPMAVRGQTSGFVRPPFTLKTSPINLLSPFQTSLDLLADIPIKNRWGMEMGLAYVFNSDPYTSYENETYSGIKVKPSLKYYVRGKENKNIYLGLAFKYAYIRNDRYVNLLRQGEQYVETALSTTESNIWGWAFRYGSQSYLGKKKRFIAESSMAIGRRYLEVSRRPYPPNTQVAQVDGSWFVPREPGYYYVFDFMMSISLGWIISK